MIALVDRYFARSISFHPKHSFRVAPSVQSKHGFSLVKTRLACVVINCTFVKLLFLHFHLVLPVNKPGGGREDSSEAEKMVVFVFSLSYLKKT